MGLDNETIYFKINSIESQKLVQYLKKNSLLVVITNF